MAEGLQQAYGGSAGGAGAQTGQVQFPFTPTRGALLPGVAGPVQPTTGAAPANLSLLQWNSTLGEWEVIPIVGTNAVSPVSKLVAIVNGAKVEGTMECRSEAWGHMTRCKGLGTVKAAEELVAGETFGEIPAGFRPNVGETLPWAISGSGAYIEIKISTLGVMTLSANLKAGEALNITGLEFFGF